METEHDGRTQLPSGLSSRPCVCWCACVCEFMWWCITKHASDPKELGLVKHRCTGSFYGLLQFLLFGFLLSAAFFNKLLDLHIYGATSLWKIKLAGVIGQEVPSSVFQNDFILIPELSMLVLFPITTVLMRAKFGSPHNCQHELVLSASAFSRHVKQGLPAVV